MSTIIKVTSYRNKAEYPSVCIRVPCTPHELLLKKRAGRKIIKCKEEKYMCKDARILSILTVFILIVAACNMPSSATTPTAQSNAVFTAAALTVQVQLTQAVPFSTPTLPVSVATNTALSVPTLPAATLAPAASATPVCDQAAFVKDITIPDGSQIAP